MSSAVAHPAPAGPTVARSAVPWLAVILLAVVMAYADGFCDVAARRRRCDRTQPDALRVLVAGVRTLLVPVFVFAVLGALTLTLRWFGPAIFEEEDGARRRAADRGGRNPDRRDGARRQRGVRLPPAGRAARRPARHGHLRRELPGSAAAGHAGLRRAGGLLRHRHPARHQPGAGRLGGGASRWPGRPHRDASTDRAGAVTRPSGRRSAPAAGRGPGRQRRRACGQPSCPRN